MPMARPGEKLFPFAGGNRDAVGDGKIFVETARLGRGSTPCPAGEDPYHPDHARLTKGQYIALPDRPARFGGLVAIHTKMPGGHHFRGETAGLEEPRLPEPLVDADRFPDVSHIERMWRRFFASTEISVNKPKRAKSVVTTTA